MPFRQLPLTSASALLVAILASPPARAEGWTPNAGERAAKDNEIATIELSVRGSHATGLVPPFRAGARDRSSVGFEATTWFGNRVRVTLGDEWLHDQTAEGPAVSGMGDVRIGTALALWAAPTAAAGLGWEGKLPNAADAGELGTDETDISFGAWAGCSRGDWAGVGALGLAILGNPLRFANQDDVPLARLRVEFSPGAFRFGLGSAVDFGTSRNPVRAEVSGTARYGERWFVELQGTAGLVPASADASGSLRLGYHWTLPELRGGE